MLSQVSVIAFDLDDTLWPCLPVIRHAESVLYRWLEDHYPAITRASDENRMIELRHEFSERNPQYKVDLTALRSEFLRELGERHGYDGNEVSARGFEIFFEARQQVEFYDDVMPSLHQLKQRFRLGAISNGNASVSRVGLDGLIEHSVSAVDLKVAKPDPLIFHHLADCFEVAPLQVLYVGDHPRYDVVGPVEAGCQAIWINREAMQWPDDLPPPDYEISDLYQLLTLLKV